MPRTSTAAPDKAGTRDRILDISLDLFIEHGYEKTSLREIAERLGFTKAAIYYHFASKDAILLALHIKLHELTGYLLEGLTDDVGPEAWAEVFRNMVDLMIEYRRLFLLHERNRTALEAMHDEGHEGHHAELEDRLRALMKDPRSTARQRVRLSSTIGALMSSAFYLGDLTEEETERYRMELRQVVSDLLGD